MLILPLGKSLLHNNMNVPKLDLKSDAGELTQPAINSSAETIKKIQPQEIAKGQYQSPLQYNLISAKAQPILKSK